MSTDYAEKERDFIASLRDDTGRDLEAWMVAIAESGLSERNAIIDWLRHQGFQFARASWLERIHHNGGRLIYAGEPEQLRRPSTSVQKVASSIEEAEPAEPPAPLRQTHSEPIASDIQSLLGEAKGLRPLAELILREIGETVADAKPRAARPLIMILAPLPFAALLPAPKMLRLFGNFGDGLSVRTRPAEAVNRLAPPFGQMMLLDDARSIDEEFRRLIRAAASQA